MRDALLHINTEGNLLKEVKDILDELHILLQINFQQQKVAEVFVRQIRHFIVPQATFATELKLESPIDPGLMYQGNFSNKDQLEAVRSTLTRADNLLRGIQGRILELRTLEKAAKHTTQSVSFAIFQFG